MDNSWYYSRDGQQHGPFPYAVLKVMARKGDLLATDHLREGDAGQWRLAADFPDLFVTVDSRSASSEPSSLKGLTMALGIEPAEPGHDPLLGRDIGGVTIVRLIAEGGMGRVYEGLQDNLRRPVAVKVIRPGFVSSQMSRRFLLETEILAKLQHPFIAQIYSAGMCDVVGTKVPFFVMEFIPDALSITKYAAKKALCTRDRLALFRKACEAVAHGHHNGVIHRDLKPSNILVDRSGTPKVIDFGVARCIDAKPEQMTALTDMGQLIGTLQYMSPEQISADPTKIDVRTDVYALGVILYELLTGQRPYEISQQQIFEAMRVVVETKPLAPSSLNSEVPRDVEMIAGKCLQKSHERRFADAAEIVTAIDRHLGGSSPRARSSGWDVRIDDVFARKETRPRGRSWAALAAFLVVLLAAGAWFSWRGYTPSETVWRFQGAGEMTGFDSGGTAETLPEGGVRLGDGVGYAAILTKQDFTPPLRVEFDVIAGADRLFDIFPGVFVEAVNTRTGIHYLFGDQANAQSSVSVFGQQIEVAHEPIEAGRLYRIAFEVDANRRLTITRDDKRVYEGSLPAHANLSGHVQCGGGLGDVTYKRLSISRRLLERGAAAEAAPGQIALSGIGDSPALKGEVPSGWLKPGVFAEIRGAGEAKFPRLPVSAYVLEMDLEFRNSRGRILFNLGEPGSGTDFQLGSLWPQDAQQDRIPSRLFRVQPWGVNWSGDAYFNPNERLLLKLVVLDDEKALVWNGKPVLRATGNVADCCLTMNATPDTDATIYRLSCRAPTPADVAEAHLPMPQRVLPCDVVMAAKRVGGEIAKISDRKPEAGRDFAVVESKMLFRWIEPGEFVMGDDTKRLPQLGAGRVRARISKGYWLGAYEVTQEQWKAVTKTDPCTITGSPYLPTHNVSWSEASRFCEQMTLQERKAGRCPAGYEYRLPTEAEWEWACRAGTDQESSIPEAERPVRERYRSLVEVGTTPANRWGLHEMLGNVPEWCRDTWQDYTGNIEDAVVDRVSGGTARKPPFVVRGGGVWFDESAATTFARTKRHDVPGGFRGFRVALAPTIVEAAIIQRWAVQAPDQQLKAVLAALQSQNFEEARALVAQAAATSHDDRKATDRLERWKLLVRYAAEYPRCRGKALAYAASGIVFEVGGRVIAVVEVTPREVRFRDRGRTMRFLSNELPRSFEDAIMERWFAAEASGADQLTRGAIALARQKPDTTIASQAWKAAEAGGESDGALLLAILEDPVISGGILGNAAIAPPVPVSQHTTAPLRQLDKRITLVFAKDTLEKAIRMISEEIAVPISINVADLQLEGITKNQSFGMQSRDKTARDTLSEILLKANPDGKLVYIVRREAGKDAIVISTRAAAAKRKEELPPELKRSPSRID